MKVCICDPLPEKAVELLKTNGFNVDVKTGMSEEELIACIKDYEAIIVRSATKVTKEVIDAASNLKLIVRGGVGIDNIDVKAAEEKGIAVNNTPGASTVAVAELTMAMLLALVRKIPEADSTMKDGKWAKKLLKGTELYQKTLGLIGSGRIGLAVAKRAQAFEMKVIAYDPYIDDSILAQNNIEPVKELNELLEKSDAISLHIPRTEETTHIINKETIHRMKDGAILLNVARGGVVDEQALYEALKSDKLEGAAIDVWEKEPPGESPLFELDNVVLCPHLGASTLEGQLRVGTEAAQIIIDFFKK